MKRVIEIGEIEMPFEILDEYKAERKELEILENESELCAAIKKLEDDFGYVIHTEKELLKINGEWARKQVDTAINEYIKSTPFMAKSIQKKHIQEYEESFKQLFPICDTISSMANLYKIKFEGNNGKFTYNARDLKRYCREICTYKPNEKTREHYKKIVELCRKINEVAEWEHSNNLSPNINIFTTFATYDEKGNRYVLPTVEKYLKNIGGWLHGIRWAEKEMDE